MQYSRRPQSGMTLLEIMISLGILGIVIAGIGTFLSRQLMVSSEASGKLDADGLLEQTRQNLLQKFLTRASDGAKIPGVTPEQTIKFGFWPPADETAETSKFKLSKVAVIAKHKIGGFEEYSYETVCEVTPPKILALYEKVNAPDRPLNEILIGNHPDTLKKVCDISEAGLEAFACTSGKRPVIRLRKFDGSRATGSVLSSVDIPGPAALSNNSIVAAGLCVRRIANVVQEVHLLVVVAANGTLVYKRSSLQLPLVESLPYATGNTAGFTVLPPRP